MVLLSLLAGASAAQVGKADAYYQDQQHLEELGKKHYQEITNSLVLVGNCNNLLNNLTANAVVEIDCIVDLNGATVHLPNNVTLVDDGGDIINGELVFNQGVIDGTLLNQTWTISGTAELSSSTFVLDKSRWDLVEGVVADARATQNLYAINDLLHLVYNLKARTVQIGALDAYFDAGGGLRGSLGARYPWLDGVQIPGDNFTLEMSPQTILRVQPNHHDIYRLLMVFDKENVTIKGGTLVGDRDQHDYTISTSTSEWGHLLGIKSGKQVVVENMTMKNATGDGLVVSSRYFTYQTKYNQSRNITVRNCIFDMNGRQGISITDGKDMLIENNQLLNTGVINSTFPNAASIGPWAGIDVEGTRTRDSQGNLVYYEYPEKIIIRNNVERGCRGAAVIIAIGYNTTVENNVTEGSIGYALGTGNIIRNNTIVEAAGANDRTGIRAGKNSTLSNFGNEVYGNTIIGFETGIRVGGPNAKIHRNIIQNFRASGIDFKKVASTPVYLNKITSNVAGAKGMYAHVTFLNKTNIYANTIEVPGNGLVFTFVNDGAIDSNYEFAIYNNKITVTNSSSHGFRGGASATAYSNNMRLFNNKFAGPTSSGQIRIEHFNQAKIYDNVGDDNTPVFVNFKGDNSLLKNNRTSSGLILNNISGNNNTIIP